MDYIEKIKQDMYLAMKANEKVKANILRSLLASLKKKQIEDKDTLSEEVFYTIVKKWQNNLKSLWNYIMKQVGKNWLKQKNLN